MKKSYLGLGILGAAALFALLFTGTSHDSKIPEKGIVKANIKKKKKTLEDRALFNEERLRYEYNMQVNPKTGKIPLDDKRAELKNAMRLAKSRNSRASQDYEFRGPSNLGGRTRSVIVDISDNTGNTLLAAAISGGVFRTTDGGASWDRTSSDLELFNASSLAQDPRPGFQNTMYYSTGEFFGNSASLAGAFYLGDGVWQSTDGGQNWQQLPTTDSEQTVFDSPFDIIHQLAINPITGELFAASVRGILRYDGTSWTNELPTNDNAFTSIAITSSGIVYVAISGNDGPATEGVYVSPTGTGAYTRIANEGTPTDWNAAGRTVLAVAPSNDDIVYALYTNGNGGAIEADLWQWDASTTTWTNYSDKLPDEPGGDLSGNDPFAVQGGYDLVVNVKPDDEKFVVIGGTNAYKIADITSDPTFVRIGGYINNFSYGLYSTAAGDTHHPDIHSLVFDPFNTDRMFTGTDGGVHVTNDINAASVDWTNLNNLYTTYQFYHVAIEPSVQADRDIVIGGAQDNGTVAGGFAGSPDNTTHSTVLGGDGVAVAISEDDNCLPFFLGFQGGNIFRDCPGGFTNIRPGGSTSQFVTYFYLDQANNNALYYAGQNRLFATAESSAVTDSTWTDLGTTAAIGDGFTDFFQSFATPWTDYDPETSYLLMGGDEGGIFRLDDPQNATDIASTVDITPPSVARVFPTIAQGMAVHPSNPNIALISYANYGIESLFLTFNVRDAEPTWIQVERNIAINSIRSVAIAEKDGRTLYFAGTARGLYSSHNPLTTDWQLESPDGVGFALISSLRYRPEDSKLLIGTHGSGMYTTNVDATLLSTTDFERAGTDFIVSPNPATTSINVSFDPSLTPGDSNYNIVDMTGRVVKTGTLKGSDRNVNVSTLSQGMYFLQISVNDKRQAVKFLKR